MLALRSGLRNLGLKWRIILLSSLVSGMALVAGFAYFSYQNYWLNVTTTLSGLMNFTDSKQQGVIRFLDQNKKLAKQLANLARHTNAKTLRNQFQDIVATDVFHQDAHPFKDEIAAGTRHIPTWNVYHSIDYVLKGVIVVSSDPRREGKIWNKPIDSRIGYSDPYYDGTVPVLTFIGPSRMGTVFVNVDARMLTNIVSGEIGNMAGISAYYLAGVGKTFDYYIVNKENVLITESRARSGQFLKGKGSELPWLTTLQKAGVVCGKQGVYTTDARCTTGCREVMGFYVGPTGKPMIGASMPFYDSDWTLVVEQEKNELLMPMWITFAQVLGILLLLGLLAAYLFSHLVERIIISPLHSLQRAIEDINISSDFGRTINVDSGDEVGKLGHAFNSMSSNLHDLYNTLDARIEERTKELKVANEQLQKEIIERKQAEMELRIAAVAFSAAESIMITDASGVIIKVNKAFTETTGYSAEEAIGQTPRLLKSGRHNADFYRAMWESIQRTGSWAGEIWDQRKNGEIYPKWLTISAVKENGGIVTNYVGTHADITERKAAEEKIQNLAFYDPLTGLPNRQLLMDRLQRALASSARSMKMGALLFIDLDNFKTLNDTLGHDVGDLLLKQVAQRLRACIREEDTVARLGGDEFVVMLEDLSEQPLEAAAQTELISKKIIATFNQPYQLAAHEYHSTPSVGATLFAGHRRTVDDLLKQADIAMYQAKKSGRNALRFFDPQMQESIKARALLEGELRKALDNQQFQLYYQIQVDSFQQSIGAEALIRWNHPERGLVPPLQFISLAEETGLIHPIGQWVLDVACAQLKAWQHEPMTRDLVLSVNVSAHQFHKADFVAQVQATLQRHAINPMLLNLELTESLLLNNIEDTIVTMNALKEIGVRFSLDDFGTGYSSLQYLKRLPLNQLKIDRSFVRDIDIDSNDKAIVRTIITMAKSMNLDVIAEGVETEKQLQMLLSKGCTLFQGYFFGEPLPIEQFAKLLKRGGLGT